MDIAADYDAGLFVPPKDAHQWLLSRVQKWNKAQQAGSSKAKFWRPRHRGSPTAPGDQVLRLVGERGVGKTWLLQHLVERDNGMPAAAVYLNLAEREKFSKPKDFVRAVQNQVRQQCGNARAILLLDMVPSHLDEHLRALEDLVLKPHVTQRGSLVIMALIHPSRACWRAPALRGGESCWLLPFEQPQTRAQLRRLDRVKLIRYRLETSHIQDYSGGLPLLNYLLASRKERRAFELFLAYCFSRIPTDERNQVKTYLEAVCVLEVLEHATIQRALEVHRRCCPKAEGYPAQAGEVRNMLQKHWLARPTPGAPGRIVLVESVRRAAREVLKAQNAELYAALNEAAQAPKGGQR
jgi:hypothetical protein